MDVAGLLKEAEFLLPQEEAKREAQILVAHYLGCSPGALAFKLKDSAGESLIEKVGQAIVRRQMGEPIQYIIEEQEFYSRTFMVNRHVLIPRGDTEVLIDAALIRLPEDEFCRVADIGTGSGVIAITLACQRPDAQIYATDISRDALVVAEDNACRHQVEECIHFRQGDLLEPLEDKDFHLIVSNPPYIPTKDLAELAPELAFEPELALDGGVDGLEYYRCLAKEAPKYLVDEGWLLVETGYDQAKRVVAILQETGYENIVEGKDWAGRPRFVAGSHPKNKQDEN